MAIIKTLRNYFTEPPQVKLPSNLDPCLSSPNEVATKLKSYVLGDGNKLDGFLKKGELAQAVQLSLSVLKSANEENDCGKTLDQKVKNLVRLTANKFQHSKSLQNPLLFSIVLV